MLEEVTSLNHSRLIHRISVALLPHEDGYDILPELEFDLLAGRLKPDVAIVPQQQYHYEVDVMRCLTPPITAIEVLSPTQAFDFLVNKIRQQYFPSGVLSAWLVVPAVRHIYLLLPGQRRKYLPAVFCATPPPRWR